MAKTTTPDTLPEVSIPCAECEIPINPETAGSLRLCADCRGDYERWLSRLTPAEQARHMARRAAEEAEENAEGLQQAHDGGDHDIKAADGCSTCEDLAKEHAEGDHDGDPRQDCAACVAVACADCERSYGPGTKCRCEPAPLRDVTESVTYRLARVGFAAHITAFDGPRLAPGIVQTEHGPRWDHRTAPAVYRVIYREDEQDNGEPGRYRLSHSHETFSTYADAKRYADPIHPSREARILRDVTESEASR